VERARRERVVVATLATAAAMLAACDGTYDVPADRRWESTHFSYLTRASESQACQDVLVPLEQHFALLQDYLGLAWPAGLRVTYEKMLDPSDLKTNSGCPLESGACAIGSEVLSADVMNLHELVHAYLWQTGDPPLVLIEGAAVALSCTTGDFAQTKPGQSWDQLASLNYGTGDGLQVYSAGAWLVGYLLRHYDPRLFTIVYQRLPQDADAPTMDGVIREIYGDSLETIWTAALAERQPHDVCIWQCSQPAIPLDGTPVATEGVCGTLEVFRPVTLAAPSTVGISTTFGGIQLESCDQTPYLSDWTFPTQLGLYQLDAGAYFIDTEPEPTTIAVSGSLPSVLAPTCADATNLLPFEGYRSARIYVPTTGTDLYMPLFPPPAGTSKVELSGGAAINRICASCDPASCVLPDAAPPWAPGQTLKLLMNPFSAGPYSYDETIVSWY
jgi:hypothetical protein